MNKEHPYPAFSKWDECDDDPATCDCSFHDNARRAAATHTAPKLPAGLSEQARRVSGALNELAEVGSQLCTLLAAVDKGASLAFAPNGDGTISGSLHDARVSPVRFETAYASKVGDVIAELARKWGRP